MSLRKNKFYALYQALSDRERKKLSFYVLYRQQNDSHELYRLSEILRKSNISELSKENVFSSLYPSKKYDDLKLRKTLTYFLRLVEDFLVAEQIVDDKFLRSAKLAEILHERKITRYFLQHTEKAIQELENSVIVKIIDRLYLYWLKSAYYNFEIGRLRKPDLNFEEVVASFEQYVSLETLNLGMSEINIRNLLKTTHKLPLLDYLNQREESEGSKDPLVELHLSGYNLLADNDNELIFNRFRSSLKNHESLFDANYLRNFYTIAINFCVKRINSGDERYIKSLYELLKDGLESKAIYLHGALPASTFQNIVITALRMGELQWVDEFMLKHINDVPKEDRESVFGYCRARLLFEQKEFEQAIDILHPLRIKDFFTELAAKVLGMKAYYEVGYDELLDSQADNFIQLLNRRKLLAYHKANFSAFVKYLKKLKSMSRLDKQSIDKLEEQIKSEQILTEKQWFLENLEAFRK